MLDSSDGKFNDEMQHVGASVGVTPIPEPALLAYATYVACWRLSLIAMRCNPFLAPFLPPDRKSQF